MKKLITLVLAFVSVSLYSQNGSIKGTVTDSLNGDVLSMSTWELFDQNDSIVQQGAADYDGNYEISNLDQGSHIVQFSFTGYKTKKIQVDVSNGKVTYMHPKMMEGAIMTEVVEIEYHKNLIKPDGPTDVIIDSKVIDNLPLRNQGIDALAGSQSSDVVYNEQTGSLYVRGSRDGTVMYVVDGIKMTEPARIPASSIAEMRVITSGIPAEFGDVTGGVIYITTKSFFYGG